MRAIRIATAIILLGITNASALEVAIEGKRLTYLFAVALLTYSAKRTSGVPSLAAIAVVSAIISVSVGLGRNFARNT